MDQIQIYDNFLNESELSTLLKIIHMESMKYGHSSGSREPFESAFFSVNLTHSFFNQYLKRKIEDTVNKKFILNRNYMHIQTFGQNGGYHIDDNGSDKYTFCLYITNIFDSAINNIAGGEFLLKPPNEIYIISIPTNLNRGMFFPSTFFHKGMAYNRLYTEKRICITWKFSQII